MATYQMHDLKHCLSPFKQGAFATKLVDGSLTTRYNLLSSTPVNRKAVWHKDDAEVGKGHEYVSRQEAERWGTDWAFESEFDAWMAAWGFSLGLGAAAVSGPVDSAYTHTLLMSVPDTVNRQNPVTTIVEDRDGEKRYYYDLAMNDIELAGGVGERPKIRGNLIGSGRYTDAAAFSLPAASAPMFLRNGGLGVQWGESASLVDVSARIKKYSIKVDNALLADDGYYPGQGLYRGRLEYSSARKISLTMTMRRDAAVELDFYEAVTELKTVFTFTGTDVIGAGTNPSAVITVQKLYIDDITPNYEEGREMVDVVCQPLYYSTDGGPLKIVIVNAANGFLKSEP